MNYAFYLNKKFQDKDERLLFVLLLISGIACSIYGSKLLDGFAYNFGRPVAGMFVAPFFCVFYITFCSLRYKLTTGVLVKTVLLFLLQLMPYMPLFSQQVTPTRGDDFGRYYLYAKNMFDHNTLWGGDKLFFREGGYHYVTQPGYRYFVYLELLLFRNLYRFVFFINIILSVVSLFFFQKLIAGQVRSRRLKAGLLLLTLLFTPYLVKNLLMGLPEWITVLLLIWVSYCWLLEKKIFAVFLLALIPFFRQNLLITVVLFFIYLLFHAKKKLILISVFIPVLLLPLYHNLYYAGQWRFFVDVFQFPFFTYAENSTAASGVNYLLLLGNFLHYAGFDLENGKPVFSLIAAIFLPYATIIYFYLLGKLATTNARVLFLLISSTAIVPVIFFGNAYYPRFELVNVVVAMVSFLLIDRYAITEKNPNVSGRLPA